MGSMDKMFGGERLFSVNIVRFCMKYVVSAVRLEKETVVESGTLSVHVELERHDAEEMSSGGHTAIPESQPGNSRKLTTNQRIRIYRRAFDANSECSVRISPRYTMLRFEGLFLWTHIPKISLDSWGSFNDIHIGRRRRREL